MKMIRFVRVVLVLILLGRFVPLHAEDIDIYAPDNNALIPTVLLLMDTGANFSAEAAIPCTAYSAAAGGGAPSLGKTGGGVEQCALVNTLAELPDSTVKIGIMVNNNNGFATDERNSSDPAFHEKCRGTYGGCLVREPTLMTAAAKASLITFIKSWKMSGGSSATEFVIKSGGDRTANIMQEAWAYFNGKIGMSGKNYEESRLGAGCQKNFIIYVGNSLNNSGGPADTGTESPYGGTNALTSDQVKATDLQKTKLTDTILFGTKTCGVTSMAAGTSSNDWSQNWADEWARLMKEQDGSKVLDDTQNIRTYTIGLIDNSGNNTCKPDYPALLSSMATNGDGKYYQASNAQDVTDALKSILNEIQAVNSVFSAASLPVSVNAQGTYLNQIFLGMFRPDAKTRPRWLGNIKQFQFILGANGLQLGDSTGAPALSSAGTGFIKPDAISFWTYKNINAEPDITGGFYAKDSHGAGETFDLPDGEMVEKGGVAQQIRKSILSLNYSMNPATPRKLYTYCPGGGTGCAASLSDASNVFAASNSAITAGKLGVADSATRTTLINWVRGEDNCFAPECNELGPGLTYTVRPSVHGDVLHSRPAVVNYGDSRGMVVFYGANDGVFRAINGSQTQAIGSVPAGGELWGLILPEHYAKLKRQRENIPNINFPATNTVNVKDYFVDGSPGLYQKLKADGTTDKAYIYLTMRRGGRFIYALDVSDPTAPSVLWRINATDPGFSELGQTWSRPRVTLIKGYQNPVLVFGAGYDPAEDAEPPTADTMGRGIFVVDAITGALVWKAVYASVSSTCAGGSSTPVGNSSIQASCEVSGMKWAIPADISFVDRDNDGKTDRFYAADLGGNVWRVDLESTSCDPAAVGKPPLCTPDTWQVTKLAALGCDTGVCASGTTPRKFFYPPNVVPVGATGAANSYDAVLLGSGDREHPLKNTNTGSAYNVVNRFYMIKDTKTGKDANTTPASVTRIESNLFDATKTTYAGTLSGFYITLATGEKVVNASITVTGTTFFGTNRPRPSDTSCIPNLGEAKGYAVNPFSATYGSTIYDGGGLPPTPVAGIVTITKPDGSTVDQTFCVGCGGASALGSGGVVGGDKKSTLGAVDLNKAVPKKPRRTYWYKR